MSRVTANGITINYEQQGSGDPLVLIPFLAADHSCYAFQEAEYAKHFTCYSLDLRGSGESDKPEGRWSLELFADDVVGVMTAVGIDRAHIFGLSLGAAVGMWVAAKYPERVQSLSLHGAWTKTDAFQRSVIESWQVLARALGSVPELVVRAVFPWCLTPELYAEQPEYVQALIDFVRSRPAQPIESFLQQSNAVLAYDIEAQLGRISAPTQITFGQHDVITSARRFAAPLQEAIRDSELVIFEGCSHAALYEHVEEFNARTLEFLRRHSIAATVAA